MKRFIACFALSVLFASACSAQMTLRPGDSYTFAFTAASLAYQGAVDMGQPPLGNFSAILNPSTLEPGTTVRLEMFESSVLDAPIATTTSTGNSLVSCQADRVWEDLQGAIRVTLLAGSATLDQVTIRVLLERSGTPNRDFWQLTLTPVPEPGVGALAGLALVAFCMGARLRR